MAGGERGRGREEEGKTVSDFEKVVEIGSKAIFNTPHKMAGTFPYMDTADQARSFICALRAAGWAVVGESSIDRLDNCVSMLMNKRVSDSIHVKALRQLLPEILDELRSFAAGEVRDE